jgi:Uma2 family endonuclease
VVRKAGGWYNTAVIHVKCAGLPRTSAEEWGDRRRAYGSREVSTLARLTLAEYDRMIEREVFDPRRDRRLEFIRGEIREMTPIGARHEEVVDRLAAWSFRNLLQSQVRVRVQSSIRLSDQQSAAEPDLAWVAQGNYWGDRPTAADTLLVIEVAETSLDYDRGEKANLYAEANITEYWIVNLKERVIEVHRDPRAGRYRSTAVYSSSDEVRPLASPDLVLRPSMLWGD